ncbi:MAG: hypothetical protein BGO68_01295 [Candidatus Amoebophilus sp. 36-38]|nr:MAG: hypothetical protein BGO68_01295 [Candidatus Amoebophilus sp. 36-38]
MNQRTIIKFILGIFLFATVSCDSCKQKELERDKAQVDATLEIGEKVEILGSVTSSDRTQLVIEVSGQIQKNNINEASILGVLVIPTDKLVKEAARDFRGSNKTLDKNSTYTKLSDKDDDHRVVYYASEISAKKKGAVSAKVFLQGGLEPGKYKAYLMLHNLLHGTYYTEEGKEFEIPNVGPPTVKTTFSKARSRIDSSGQSIIEVVAEAEAANFGTMQGGFLFIEKKDPKTSSLELLSEWIKSDKDLPVTTDFEKLAGTSDVIIHSFNNGPGSSQAQANNNLDTNDTNGLFQKGATYHVYAYLFELVGKEKRYVVSQEDIELTISKIEVELEMKEGKIVKLFKGLNDQPDDIHQMSFSFTGNIKKQVATYKPQVGFILSVKTLDIDRDETLIKNLLTVPPTDGYYQLGQNVAFFNPTNTPEDFTGDIKYEPTIPQIPVELGQTYHIYFFLKDKGRDVFLSTNPVSLVVPNAKLEVTKFIANKKGSEFVVEEESRVENQRFSVGLGKKISTGYVIYPTSTSTIPKHSLEDILKNTNGKKLPSDDDKVKDTYKTQLGDANIVFLDESQVSTACKSVFGAIPDNTAYNVSLVFSCENAVFYKIVDPTIGDPQIQQFVWYKPDKIGGGQGPVNGGNPVHGDKYEYSYGDNFANATIHRLIGKNKFNVELNEIKDDPGNNEALIKEILSHVFKGPSASANIKKFMENMDTV